MTNYVYTAITGGKDTLKDTQNTLGASFVAFTDKPFESKVWERRVACNEYSDPVRNAKSIKSYRIYTFRMSILWIDGTMTLKVPLEESY